MEEPKLTESEKRIVERIRNCLAGVSHTKPYHFWFVYTGSGATNWEGGFELPMDKHFRNQYTIQKGKPLIKNWD